MKTKHLVLAIIILIGSIFPLHAIEEPNPAGTMTLGVNAGLFPGIGFNASFDYTIVSVGIVHITGGAMVGYQFGTAFDKQSYSGSNVNLLAVAARATGGINLLPMLEVHAGAIMGYGNIKGTYKDQQTQAIVDTYMGGTPSRSGFCAGGIIGARYYFFPSLAASAEVSFSRYTPYLSLGVAFRF